ncbi:MAG: YeiH family protein [Anaerovoracaceae bacterium]|jgi:uncharacterized integral membrane protein (TIGR00698 family)
MLCFVIAICAFVLGKVLPLVGGPVFSLIIGAIVALFVKRRDALEPGISFTSKKILQYAIVLLGFGLNLSVIVTTGQESLPIIIVTIVAALTIAFLLHKVLSMTPNTSILVGVGSSICGGSAIIAASSVIGADDEEIAQSISVIFFFNVIAALIFPTIGGLLDMSDHGFSLFAGTAINDTSSVTAAAASWDALYGSDTLSTAAVVKLTRTLAIIPITLILSFYRMKKDSGTDGGRVNMGRIFPFFIIYFVAASIFTTLCVVMGVSGDVFLPMKSLSKFLILMAMGAIGLNTNVVKLVRSGIRPLFMGLCCWIGIIGSSLMMQRIMGFW